MDEFGQGTSQISGLCLLTAVLDSYAKRGVNTPHVFASTHLQRVTEKLSNVPLVEAQVIIHDEFFHMFSVFSVFIVYSLDL